MRRKSTKKYFIVITKYRIKTDNFCNLIKPFRTNTGILIHQDIIIFDAKKIIMNETVLVEVFNNHYFNVFKKLSGKKSWHVACDNNIEG